MKNSRIGLMAAIAAVMTGGQMARRVPTKRDKPFKARPPVSMKHMQKEAKRQLNHDWSVMNQYAGHWSRK